MFELTETNGDLDSLLSQALSLIDSEPDSIANAANLTSLLYHQISELNWVGFYFLRSDELVLGPFQGQLACTRIGLGKGVCGTAYSQQQALMVNDVHAFDGHIACDAASRSEIVVPFRGECISGVLDIDSPVLNRFDADLFDFFKKIAAAYGERCNSL